MKTLLKICNTIEDSLKNDTTLDIDNEKDLPKAIYIHFLTRIVTDSSLASDCMYYSAELAALAFDNLADSHWQIRYFKIIIISIPYFIEMNKNKYF